MMEGRDVICNGAGTGDVISMEEGKVRERPFHYLRKKEVTGLPLKSVIKRYKKELKEEYKIVKKETKKKNKSFQKFVGKKHDMNEIMRDVQLGYQGIQFKGEECEKNLEKSSLRYAANPTLFIQKCIRPIPHNEMGGFRIHFPSTEEMIMSQNHLLASSKNTSSASASSTSICNDLLPISELNVSIANQDCRIAEGGESESTKWITNISITGIKDNVVSSEDDIIHISTGTTKKKYNTSKSKKSKGAPKRASTSIGDVGRPRKPSKPRKDDNDEEIQLLQAPKNWVGYYS